MGNKKRKLLQKYLEKKERQKERDSLVERLKVLQSESLSLKKDTLISSSQIRRKKGVPEKSKRTTPVRPQQKQKVSLQDIIKSTRTEEVSDGVVWKKAEKRKETETKKKLSADLLKTDKKYSKSRRNKIMLPITHMEDEIVSSVKENYITVITGGTGTGKSTQVPQFLYENGLAVDGKICITQPRRVSAYAVAKRISEEQESKLGETCGYRMRYESKISGKTKIAVLTEGVLLEELSEDAFLSGYSIVILDEIHERSISQDTVLLVLAKLAVKSKVRVVLMSASISDPYIFQLENISGVKVNRIEVESLQHSVEVHYLPLREYNYLEELKARIKSLDEKEGSVLAFVSTKDETERIKNELKMKSKIVYALHSDTAEEVQQSILESRNAVIICTNVAETSLTLPDVKYVIDGGREVQKKYDYATGAYKFNTILISKESAEQRQGRTGRVGPGVCYRIYSTVEYEMMNSHREPEIQREKVLPLVAALVKAGVRPDRIDRVKTITAPPGNSIQIELEELRRIGVINTQELTEFGRKVLSLPLNPFLAAALLRSQNKSVECLECMLNIVVSVELYNAKKVWYTPAYIADTKTYIEVLCRPDVNRINKKKLLQHILKGLNRVEEKKIDVELMADRIMNQTIEKTDSEVGIFCGKLMAWAFSTNILTAYNGKFYHRGEEVLMRAPLPEISSEKPVPIVYYSLIHPDSENLKKVSMVSAVIPNYHE